jgi:hypothetical protein
MAGLILAIVVGALFVWGVTKVFGQSTRDFSMDLVFLLGLLAVGTLIVVFFPISLGVAAVGWLVWVAWNRLGSARKARREREP